MAGKFEITRTRRESSGTGSGEIVATGESCPTKAGAKKGIEAVQQAADDASSDKQTRMTPPRPSRS